MYYLLNHSKGALILLADSREQVVEWSRRQLGPLARTASVVETDAIGLESWVERSGTGLEAQPGRGCRPMMSITADLPQRLESLKKEDHSSSGTVIEQRSFVRERIWH